MIEKPIEEIKEKLIGATITDIEVLDSGKACIFVKGTDNREYAIDCTGNKAVVTSFSTEHERLELLEEKLELLGKQL